MRIAMIAPGSRGDVQPYIALGKGLQSAGHSVLLLTHQNFETLVTSHGLDFWAISASVQDIAESQALRERVEKGNFLMLMAQMAKEAERGSLEMARSAWNACQGMDLLLGGMGGMYTGLALAEKLDLPFVQAHLLPFTPTRYFPGVLTPSLPPWLGGTVNRLSHQLTRQMIWQGFRTADRLAREKVLGLSAAPFWGPYHSPQTEGMPVLYGFSPAVVPLPPDWQDRVYVTGYWFLDATTDWAPPTALMDFLESGPKPIYIGFGSMSSRKPEETADLVLDALRQTGQRAVLLSGWGGLQKSDLPDTVFMIDSVPHDWLFPRMRAIVHHGGAGTTAASLRAGVPAVVIPFFGDQPFWGRRIADLGVGPEPIPRQKLTASRLAQAIQQVVTNEDLRRCASALGAKISREDGVARAVEIIQTIE